MTEQVLTEFKQKVEELVLVPSDGGRFEVFVDDRLIFSKLGEGRFPKYEEEIRPHLTG